METSVGKLFADTVKAILADRVTDMERDIDRQSGSKFCKRGQRETARQSVHLPPDAATAPSC